MKTNLTITDEIYRLLNSDQIQQNLEKLSAFEHKLENNNYETEVELQHERIVYDVTQQHIHITEINADLSGIFTSITVAGFVPLGNLAFITLDDKKYKVVGGENRKINSCDYRTTIILKPTNL
jgi:hypothetical protein